MAYQDLKVVGTRPIRPDGVDKVTGRAQFGADLAMAGQLVGRVKRSPHAHARIVSIDATKALALPGVKAMVTAGDFPDIPDEMAFVGEGPMNFRDLSRNCMARDKVLYEGHAVAAVAATTAAIAEEAVGLIDVVYEVLPHVIDVEAAMAGGGAGFGGKTLFYLEPLALALSRKCGRPVKMVMSREEVFKATGPTSGGTVEVKIGAKKDGTITAAEATLKYQAGAFAGSP